MPCSLALVGKKVEKLKIKMNNEQMIVNETNSHFDVSISIQQLRQGLVQLHHLCLSDVTDGHAANGIVTGQSLNAAGKEYLLLVVSDTFQGMKTIARHRFVQRFFEHGFDSGEVHSMQLRTWTAEQWNKKGKPQSVRKNVDCSLGKVEKGSILSSSSNGPIEDDTKLVEDSKSKEISSEMESSTNENRSSSSL